MPVTTVGDFGRLIGARMRADHESLARRWLVRLNELLPVAANEVFPSQALLDHIPALIQEIADYLEDTDADEFAANTFVVDKARELGELRYEQRASVHQLLREYRVLGAILVTFVEQETRPLVSVAPIEVIAVLGRVAQAVGVLQQTTVETFIAKYTAQIDDQTRRLENFNRMVSHELRQPIGALQFAVKLADDCEDHAARAGYREVIERNLTRLVRLTDQLAMMSRLKPTTDNSQTQHLPLALVAREVARQLRDMADRRGVDDRDRRRPAGPRRRRRRRGADPRQPGLERDQVLGSGEAAAVRGAARRVAVRRLRHHRARQRRRHCRRSTCRGSSSGRIGPTRIATRSSAPTASASAWRSCATVSPIRAGRSTVESVLGRGGDVHRDAAARQSRGLRRPPTARYNLLFAASPSSAAVRCLPGVGR